ncbi:MAG TPA: TetR/AcrR family transcriptional regulator [Candidatus Dormibacteraeota bacterium]|nr:TetR/AcrR family transcriptional regulator [Candidatus Dormibacteraeota bacterium]
MAAGEESATHPPGSTWREERRSQARRAIQLAALRVAAEHGLKGLTVQAISEAAGIAPRTFFTYFSSKEEALMVDLPWEETRLRAALSGRPDGETALQTLRALIGDAVGDIASRWEEVGLWRRLASSEPEAIRRYVVHQRDLRRTLIRLIAERMSLDPERDLYPELVVGASLVALRAAIYRWWDSRSADGGGSDLRRLVDEAFDVLERGL